MKLPSCLLLLPNQTILVSLIWHFDNFLVFPISSQVQSQVIYALKIPFTGFLPNGSFFYKRLFESNKIDEEYLEACLLCTFWHFLSEDSNWQILHILINGKIVRISRNLFGEFEWCHKRLPILDSNLILPLITRGLNMCKRYFKRVKESISKSWNFIKI